MSDHQAKKLKTDDAAIWELPANCPPISVITRQEFRAGFDAFKPIPFLECAKAYAQMTHFHKDWRLLQRRYQNLNSTYCQALWSNQTVRDVYPDKFPSQPWCVRGINTFKRYKEEASAAGNHDIYLEACARLTDWISCTINKFGHALHQLSLPSNMMDIYADALDVLEKELATSSSAGSSAAPPTAMPRVVPNPSVQSSSVQSSSVQSSSVQSSSVPSVSAPAPARAAASGVALPVSVLHSDNSVLGDPEELEKEVRSWELDLTLETTLPWNSFTHLRKLQDTVEGFALVSTRWPGREVRTPGMGFVLFGPPGVGKTAFVLAAAKEFGLPIYMVNAAKLKQHLKGVSEKLVVVLFKTLRARGPCILFFDEFEGIFGQTAANDGDNLGTSALIKEQWGLLLSNHCPVMVFASTNAPWLVESDVGLWRRFRTHVHISLPEQTKLMSILSQFFEDVPNRLTGKHLRTICTWLQGGSSADVTEFLYRLVYNHTKLAMVADNWKEGEVKGHRCLFPAPLPQISKQLKDMSADDRAAASYPEISIDMVKAAINDGDYEVTVSGKSVQQYVEWDAKRAESLGRRRRTVD